MTPKEATRKRTALKDIDARLVTSRARQKGYEAKGDARSAEIEESVQDRLLRDRLAVTKS